MRTLYISYFGLHEPLVYSQVLPYLRELVKGGVEPYLLTFEPSAPVGEEADLSRAELARDGIRWHWLRYHKAPTLPATLYDILAGAVFALRLARKERIEVLHARAHFSMAMALLARAGGRFKLVFDLRGLVADEYVDAGIFRAGAARYRAVKFLERAGLRAADQVIVLTERLRAYLLAQGLAEATRIEVIPCCIDTSRFQEARANLQQGERGGPEEIVYAGSVTGLYLLEEMVAFFKAFRARRPSSRLKVLTMAPPGQTSERISRLGLASGAFWVGAVPPRDVPGQLARATAGISFRKPTFSQIGASPTKIPEYLASGIPVVVNAGIGDSDDFISGQRVGVVVKALEPSAYEEAAKELDALLGEPELGARCVSAARARFDMGAVGGARYRRVYERLQTPASPSPSSPGPQDSTRA